MGRSKQELKDLAIAAIDARRDEIIELGHSIYKEPELGYKEFKTAKKFQNFLDKLGVKHQDEVAITGVLAPFKGKESKVRVAVMGELDAVVVPGHVDADPVTGAAHCCGHHAMIAGIAGVATALADTDIMNDLSGDIVVMAVPAEEYVELEYRKQIIDEGKISLLGGKQEFIKLGVMDDIDIMIMQHTQATEGETHSDIKVRAGSLGNGFVGKLIQYKGKAAHAGGAPHMGINALNAANVGLMAVHAQRETFRNEHQIRVHPIMTKGGDLVNVVPDDVRLETYVRGAETQAIMDASAKVTRAFEAGGMAIGAECIVTELPGYMPGISYPELEDVMYQNLKMLCGDAAAPMGTERGAGSTDCADVQAIMPAIQAYIGGASGTFHGESYRMVNPDLAYLTAAKALVCTAIDLLAEGAEKGLSIKENCKPPMTKEQYLKEWCHIEL
ncbi:MAG: amidohydrolase [Clostridia bacterium]|nr:amidohydrolase [Clostridia bacterium]